MKRSRSRKKDEVVNCIFCFKRVRKSELLGHQKSVDCREKKQDISFNQGLSLLIHEEAKKESSMDGASPNGSPGSPLILKRKKKRRIIESPESSPDSPLIRRKKGKRRIIGSPSPSPSPKKMTVPSNLLNQIRNYNATHLKKILSKKLKASIQTFPKNNLRKAPTKRSRSPNNMYSGIQPMMSRPRSPVGVMTPTPSPPMMPNPSSNIGMRGLSLPQSYLRRLVDVNKCPHCGEFVSNVKSHQKSAKCRKNVLSPRRRQNYSPVVTSKIPYNNTMINSAMERHLRNLINAMEDDVQNGRTDFFNKALDNFRFIAEDEDAINVLKNDSELANKIMGLIFLFYDRFGGSQANQYMGKIFGKKISKREATSGYVFASPIQQTQFSPISFTTTSNFPTLDPAMRTEFVKKITEYLTRIRDSIGQKIQIVKDMLEFMISKKEHIDLIKSSKKFKEILHDKLIELYFDADIKQVQLYYEKLFGKPIQNIKIAQQQQQPPQPSLSPQPRLIPQPQPFLSPRSSPRRLPRSPQPRLIPQPQPFLSPRTSPRRLPRSPQPLPQQLPTQPGTFRKNVEISSRLARVERCPNCGTYVQNVTSHRRSKKCTSIAPQQPQNFAPVSFSTAFQGTINPIAERGVRQFIDDLEETILTSQFITLSNIFKRNIESIINDTEKIDVLRYDWKLAEKLKAILIFCFDKFTTLSVANSYMGKLFGEKISHRRSSNINYILRASPQTSPTYSQTSPTYSPTSPSYAPTSPTYVPTYVSAKIPTALPIPNTFIENQNIKKRLRSVERCSNCGQFSRNINKHQLTKKCTSTRVPARPLGFEPVLFNQPFRGSIDPTIERTVRGLIDELENMIISGNFYRLSANYDLYCERINRDARSVDILRHDWKLAEKLKAILIFCHDYLKTQLPSRFMSVFFRQEIISKVHPVVYILNPRAVVPPQRRRAHSPQAVVPPPQRRRAPSSPQRAPPGGLFAPSTPTSTQYKTMHTFDPSPVGVRVTNLPSYSVKYETIPRTDPEFQNIEDLVKNDRFTTVSIKGVWRGSRSTTIKDIIKIVKIDNPFLLNRFNDKFGMILAELGDPDVCRVTPLFHGTSLQAIKPISEGGYLGSLNTTSAYGGGTYFTPSATIAMDYAHREKNTGLGADIGVLILNQVILGITKNTDQRGQRKHVYFSSLIQRNPTSTTAVMNVTGSPGAHTGGNVGQPGYAGSVFVAPDDDMVVPTHIIYFKFPY